MAKLKEKQLTVKSKDCVERSYLCPEICVMDALKDFLEELMDLKRPANITFRAVDGGVSTVKGHIVKIDTVSGRDMVETDAGLLIGTDQILEVNGRRFENIC